jgi:hypothetical protein
MMHASVSKGTTQSGAGAVAGSSLAENKRIATAFVDGLHDLTGATCGALMSDSAVWQVMARTRSLPLGAPLPRAEFIAMMQSMRSVFPTGVRHEVRGIVAEGDRVAVESESYADLPGGLHYNNLYHFLLVIRGGKVEMVREYTDLLYAKELVFAA